jgi:Spy/CpxP family protein refolding chaperone
VRPVARTTQWGTRRSALKVLLSLAAVLATAIPTGVIATPQCHGGAPAGRPSPYAEVESSAISSLSANDVAALLGGEGWGLAKPAELNGYPGPRHVLELADALQLTSEQRASVQAAYERMKARAQGLGANYVAAEHALDEIFRSGADDTGALSERVARAERLRAELRLTHLNAHLEVRRLLSPAQRQSYMALRGYAARRHGGHRP